MYVQSTYIEHSEHTTTKKKHPPKEQFGLQKTIVVGGICVTTTHHDSHFTHQYLRDVLTKLSLLLKIFTFVSLDNCVCKVFLGKLKF